MGNFSPHMILPVIADLGRVFCYPINGFPSIPQYGGKKDSLISYIFQT